MDLSVLSGRVYLSEETDLVKTDLVVLLHLRQLRYTQVF